MGRVRQFYGKGRAFVRMTIRAHRLYDLGAVKRAERVVFNHNRYHRRYQRIRRDQKRVLSKECANCKGDGWVCENHPQKAWGGGFSCCDGAGMPCVCNPDGLTRHVRP